MSGNNKTEHEVNKFINTKFPQEYKMIQIACKMTVTIKDARTLAVAVKGTPAKPEILVYKGDCLHAASHHAAGKTAVLDFASDTNPGGGWRGKQTGTQEESICRRSTLGVTLESAKYPIALHGAIFVPYVFSLPGGIWSKDGIWISVIAASLRGGAEGKFLSEKTDGIIKMAISNGTDTLVLGSWGCGAFGNDATEVAKSWKSSIEKFGTLKKVIFAVMKYDVKIYEELFST